MYHSFFLACFVLESRNDFFLIKAKPVLFLTLIILKLREPTLNLFLIFGFQVGEVDDAQDSTWNLYHVGDGCHQQSASPDESSGATSSDGSSHITRLASIDSFDSRWYHLNSPYVFYLQYLFLYVHVMNATKDACSSYKLPCLQKMKQKQQKTTKKRNCPRLQDEATKPSQNQ